MKLNLSERIRNLNSIGVRQFFSIFILFVAVSVIFLITSLELSRFQNVTIDLVTHHINEVRLLGKLEHIMLQIKAELEDIAHSVSPHSLDILRSYVVKLDETGEQLIIIEEMYPDELTYRVKSSVTMFNSATNSYVKQLSDLEERNLWLETQQKARHISAVAIDSVIADCSYLVRLENAEIIEVTEQIEKQCSAARVKIFIISSAVIIISSFIALVLALSITNPIKHLAHVAEDVAAGNLTLRSNIKKSDEIGLLSRAFDNMVAHLEKILTEQKLFLTDTSHELLTPITVIKGHLQVLGRNPNASPEEQKKTFDMVFSELYRIERILDSLLDLARSSSKDLLNLTDIELPSFIMDVFKKAEVLGQRNWFLGEVPDVDILVDADLLSGALLNLLRNAVTHTKEGDNISLSSTLVNGCIQFMVTDTGEGIPDKDLPRIFERFFRGDNSSAKGKSGSGLGLSIVKAVAEVHGGGVSVQSTVGTGSTFYLSIPI